MKVRFLADADLNKAIVNGGLRREPSLDFLTAQAAGLRGMNDRRFWRWRPSNSGYSFHTMWAQCLPIFVRSEM